MNIYKGPPSGWDCGILLSSVPRSGEVYRTSFELPMDGVIEHWGQSYRSCSPVRADIEANYTGERILVRIAVRADFSLPCSRCLADTGVAILGDLRYLFTLRSSRQEPKSDEDEDDAAENGDVDVIPIDHFQSELDLAQCVWEVLLLSLPERALCKEDCEGLCIACGQNLNERDCGCTEDGVDPRFEILRDLK